MWLGALYRGQIVNLSIYECPAGVPTTSVDKAKAGKKKTYP
jgi:hypothetical protein